MIVNDVAEQILAATNWSHWITRTARTRVTYGTARRLLTGIGVGAAPLCVSMPPFFIRAHLRRHHPVALYVAALLPTHGDMRAGPTAVETTDQATAGRVD
jgi:hypothetical protein